MAPRTHTRVRDVDRGFRRFRREAATVAEPRLVVGVTEESGRARHADNGSTAAEVAVFAEFGTRHQRPSPFLRSVADDGSAREPMRAACGHVAGAGPSAPAAAAALEQLGAELADRVRARASAAGLVDEGVLLDSITHEVRS